MSCADSVSSEILKNNNSKVEKKGSIRPLVLTEILKKG